jgi:hypothetical protein
MGWARQYRRLLADIVGQVAASHGYPLAAVKAAESRLGLRLAPPLRDYFLSVGRHKINHKHNRLLAPNALWVAQGRLVFMEENQNVVYWGIRRGSTAADPVVFQTTDPQDDDWFAEVPCSQFLAAMLCWQAVSGGLPNIGYSDWVDAGACLRKLKAWPRVGRFRALSAFARGGQVVCVEQSDSSALIHVGARNKMAFTNLATEIGVSIHEA